MNYLSVPDSKLKLVDGNVVQLERFPGLKWVLHNGWYSYNGRQYSGWYFSSIPSQTILPVSNQDLRMITLVSSKPSDEYPEYPLPPSHPGPGYPDDGYYHHHHHHHPNENPGGPHSPIFPPVCPDPEPEKPAFFSTAYKAQLDSAFISVPTLKKRDLLDTTKLPDGKIVRVNSVNGEPKYYAWSAFNDHWEELNFVLQESLEEQLSNYYDKTEVNQYLEAANGRIDSLKRMLTEARTALEETISGVDRKVDNLSSSTDERLSEINKQIEAIQEELDGHDTDADKDFTEVEERLSKLEDAVFAIQKLSEMSADNTVLVSKEGGISDSGVAIGDDSIDEPSEFASDKTLATEKAVARKVEESQPKWTSF